MNYSFLLNFSKTLKIKLIDHAKLTDQHKYLVMKTINKHVHK